MTNRAVAARSGLFRRGDRTEIPVPLAGVTVDAELHGLYARVVVSHRYVNREPAPIEAVYVFPLDEGAAVCGFEALIDGTLVVGEVHERDEAFGRYDDAIAEGHGAFLLDEERPDVFQASIGNLLPGREAVVKVTYVAELTVTDGRLRFVVPTTVSPRYAPAEDQTGVGRPDAEALNPPVELSVPYGLNLAVRAVMPGAIAAVESPSHPVSLRMTGAEATITLAQRDAALDRDFVLTIEAEGLDAPHVMIERQEDGTEAIGVAFAPRFETTSAPAEVIFVVDRSGSMKGQSIAEVRNALQLSLRSLTSACRFNIVGFGSQHEMLFPDSRPYDQASLEIASAHVAALDADLGGTEILPALQAVLTLPPSEDLPRQLVVLTDGEVTNTDAVIALAASHAARTRIFTFGIGAGASHHLVRGLARAGGGTAEFIHPGERIEPKVLRQLGRLLSPALTNVKVEWTDGTVTQAPSTVPPVFSGGRLVTYGFVKGPRPSAVRLSAHSPAGPLTWELALSTEAQPSSATSGIVGTLAARARIRELEEGEWAAERGSRQSGRRESRVRGEIIALSLRYGVLSRETSFVAVERRETPVVADMALRRVPIVLTTGWGGVERLFPAMRQHAVLPYARLSSTQSPPMSVMRRGISFLTGDEREDEDADSAVVFSRMAEPLQVRALQVDDVHSRMQALVVLQRADGSWALTRELAQVIGQDLDDLRAAVPGGPGGDAATVRAWATALALAWLEVHAADRQDEWELLAGKARRWLHDVPDPGLRAWTWQEMAHAVVT
jgi:hypothetical protein